MMRWISRLFARGEPALSQASARDAPAIARLHAVSFRRGWSDGEFEQLLIDRNVIAHRAMRGGAMDGFIRSGSRATLAPRTRAKAAPAPSSLQCGETHPSPSHFPTRTSRLMSTMRRSS
jgi:hypothetical protein